MTTSPVATETDPAAGSDQRSILVTSMRRFVPAIMLTQLGFCVAVLTPLQLLLVLRVDAIAGGNATAAFSVVTGFGALAALVFSPIAGRISDRTRTRLGRRRTWMLTGSSALALLLVAMTATTAVWQVVVLWCLVQAVGSFQFAANNAILADQIPAERRGRISGLVGLVAAIGPLAGLALVNAMPAGGAAQWLAIAVIALVASVAAVVLFRDPPETSPRPPLDLRTLASTFWFNPRRHPALGWAWLVRFLITCAYASTTYFAFLAMERFDINAAEVGPIVLTLGLTCVACIAVASVVAGFLSDTLRRQKPFVSVAGILSAAALLVMASAESITSMVIGSAVLGLGIGTFFAVDLALCVRVLPNADDAGKDLGIINIANSLPQSLVPFTAPALLAVGGYPALFSTLAGLGLLGAIAVLRVPEVGRENSPGRAAPITRA